MSGSKFQLVLTTCPDAPTAESIAQTLVEERLAACVNVLPQVQSVYRWRGGVERAQELLVIAKIPAAGYAAVERRISALHPYELPEIVAIPIGNGLPGYLAWLEDPERNT